MHTSNTQSHPPASFVLLLAMTMALGPLAIDTYLPAFPAIAESLNSSVHQVSLSISIYIFMLAMGQLVGGPLSDRFGRQPIMLAGLSLFAAASLMLYLSSNLQQLLAFRALQAFGAGWAAVCVPAMVRDRLSGVEAARFFSLIGLLMVAAPAIAPSIGSLLLTQFGWGSIFIFLAVYGLLMVCLLQGFVFRLGHSQAPHIADMTVWARYRAVFAVRPALRYMLLQALAFSVMLIFITHSSFIYQQHFGASPGLFAILFGANIVLMLAANLLNRKLLQRITAQRILRAALMLQALGIGLLIIIAALDASLWFFLPAMMLTVGTMGAITPNIQACYMEYFASHGGTASALLGAAQFSIAGLLSAATTLLPETLLLIVISQAVCSALCLALIVKKSTC